MPDSKSEHKEDKMEAYWKVKKVEKIDQEIIEDLNRKAIIEENVIVRKEVPLYEYERRVQEGSIHP